MFRRLFAIVAFVTAPLECLQVDAAANPCIEIDEPVTGIIDLPVYDATTAQLDTALVGRMLSGAYKQMSLYELPYSETLSNPDKSRLWVNTGVLAGAFAGTLLVLECLPEDATSWNRAELQCEAPIKRWFKNVFKRGPEWDHDNPIFNYVLHPYAGAVYFMSARSCGCNFWQSMLYSAAVSTIGWEFGIEACMERPSYQDIVITPVVGSVIGEAFYRAKRSIVAHDYTLAGSRVLGNVVAFLVDPVNEVINLFRGSDTRRLHQGRDEVGQSQAYLAPATVGGSPGFMLRCEF